jgi:hypothetical protein
MPVVLATKQSLPDAGVRTVSEQADQSVSKRIAVLESIRRKLEDTRGKSSKAPEMHKVAAPVVSAVLDAYGKDAAAAELIGEGKTVVSEMRNGARGMSAWQLVRLLDDSPESFLEFSAYFCQRHRLALPAPAQRLTREQVREEAMRFLLESGPLLKLFAREVAERHGCDVEQVSQAVAK